MSSGRKRLAQVPDDLLRFDRKALIVGEASHLLHDRAPQRFQRRVVPGPGTEGDAAQRLADVAECPGGDDVARIDLGRERIDVDDGLVAVGVPLLGMVFHHVVADTDHDVGTLESKGHQVAGFQPDGPQRQLVGEREGALGHEGRRHGDAQHLGEAYQRVAGVLADDAVAGHDDRTARCRDNARGFLDLGLGRGRGVRGLHLDRPLIDDLGLGDVLGEVDEAAARFLGLRDLERFAHDLRDDVGLADLACCTW